MSKKRAPDGHGLRFEADEPLPAALAVGLGLQLAVLTVTVTIIVPTAVMRIGGAGDAYLTWAVFAAVAISGIATALQALRFGRIGGGLILVMGSSAAFIGVSITAVEKGGPAMLATLVVFAALFQILLSARLAMFRKFLTPAVSGTVIMLIPVTVMPILFRMLDDIPEGSPDHAAPSIALVTILAIVGISLKGTAMLRQWAPIIGVVAGTAVAAFFGLYDLDRIAAASWIGLPSAGMPGLDLEFGPVFWALLPAFLLTAVIGTIRAISSSAALQQVSWRRKRPMDFRAVQGTVTVDGVNNLLCGLAGTVPNTTNAVAAPLIEITGVAARVVGVATGAIFLVLAFLPKALAVVLAIPGPVAAAYFFVLLGMLFVVGIGMVMQDGMDYRKGVVVGVSFWLGVGFQNGAIYPELASEFAGGIFSNGITAGDFIAIVMTWIVDFFRPRPVRTETEFAISALPKIHDFLAGFAARNGWDDAMADRLDAAGEETLLTLLGPEDRSGAPDRARRLRLSASKGEDGAVLEFIVAPRGENVEERLAVLDARGDETPIEQEVSLRLLRHLASSVRHQQYHDTDIVTVQVKYPAPESYGVK
ncbi:MAG: hypothetical protein F4114_06360 [Rhodospirillaceae bacterium]|nr:hypothetical protein [Rhodospirillaceae bacterium]MYB13866.1 hypothetical protein [Rhodospirillaceae bacterium]MYI48697.1 hypothetical protein [Rhodospirillaceae bacterium]